MALRRRSREPDCVGTVVFDSGFVAGIGRGEFAATLCLLWEGGGGIETPPVLTV